MNNPIYTILVPAYNAEGIITESIMNIIKEIKNFKDRHSFRILVVENGSTDKTDLLVRNLAKDKEVIEILNLKTPDLGKAIKYGILNSESKYIIYLPADLSYGTSFIPLSIKLLKQYNVVFGSKHLSESSVNRSVLRNILSFGFRVLVKILFNFSIKDTQGVKAFERNLFLNYLKYIPDGFLWDIGFVFITKKRKYKSIEVPCKVIDKQKNSTIKQFRHSINMFLGLIRYRLNSIKYQRLLEK
ncbi:MAG: glycosyltransferase [Candidatus Heimdallarchaeaceae archaeon]